MTAKPVPPPTVKLCDPAAPPSPVDLPTFPAAFNSQAKNAADDTLTPCPKCGTDPTWTEPDIEYAVHPPVSYLTPCGAAAGQAHLCVTCNRCGARRAFKPLDE
jgi:hypothetical protein